ncbi:MAG: hypothetical protein N4A54_03845 [Peptostreptococcaceae bacterium]|jgi:arginyl-tRNA synthetase|nr:hypothetical protein [Peptostreptococcaceae bacterium]
MKKILNFNEWYDKQPSQNREEYLRERIDEDMLPSKFKGRLEDYIKKHLTNEYNNYVKKEQIINTYKKEFPSIKHISEKTVNTLDNLNKQNGNNLTIKEIKQTYKELGKRLEQENGKSDMQDFKVFKDIIDDLKQSQLKMKQEMAHEKSIQNEMIKSKDIEMI